MQVVARHCYALTYEEVHVRQWEQALAEDKFGEKPEDDEDSERLRPKYVIVISLCKPSDKVDL